MGVCGVGQRPILVIMWDVSRMVGRVLPDAGKPVPVWGCLQKEIRCVSCPSVLSQRSINT